MTESAVNEMPEMKHDPAESAHESEKLGQPALDAQPVSDQPNDASGELSGDADEMSERIAQINIHEPRLLKEEIVRLQDERDGLDEQYNTLLVKVSQMRTTLGERLQQDAEELDRREQHIESLTQRVNELEEHTSTLRNELSISNDEARQLTRELEQLRTHVSSAAQDESKELNRLESRCRELEDALHARRVDVDRWESACMEERALKEELDVRLKHVAEALQHANARVHELEVMAEQEKQVARQMQQTLEELQNTQDGDLQRAVGEMQQQVDDAESKVEKYKLQVHSMEAMMEDARVATSKCEHLEQEVKEKNLLIGKLRYEAVILNEHLKNALGRLRRESTDDLIDRRLMSNLFLQFLAVPRADTKRFEILRLMASILQWDDNEREKAGLQRQSERSQGYGFLGLGSLMPSPRKSGSSASVSRDAPSSAASDESMSNLFVEFLLSEVERGKKEAFSGADSGESTAEGVSVHDAQPPAQGADTFDLHSLEHVGRDEPRTQTHAASADHS